MTHHVTLSPISGFPEYAPHHMVEWSRWIRTLSSHFQSHGYGAMETPAVERMSTLLSKGDDSEIYAIQRWDDVLDPPARKDHASASIVPDQVLGLRFDLTIPLARYVTQYQGSLTFPFRRHHIGPVWRGERPQEGRYRQFYQCDIDSVGHNTLDLHHDHDILCVLDQALDLLGLEPWLGPRQWHLNHRDILHAWAEWAGIQDTSAALRWIDKYPKITWEALKNALQQLGALSQAIDHLHSWSQQTNQTTDSHITTLTLPTPCAAFEQAKRQLLHTFQWATARGIPPSRLCFSPLLARGLSYYSGLVFEATLANHPSLGSVGGGGRYDHLTSTLGSRAHHPGVGGSLGISRLFGAWVKDHPQISVPSGDILVTCQEPSHLARYLTIAHNWRQLGWRVETCVESWPLAKQIKYAHKKGYPIVALANQDDLALDQVVLKHMLLGQQKTVPLACAPQTITEWLISCHTPKDTPHPSACS